MAASGASWGSNQPATGTVVVLRVERCKWASRTCFVLAALAERAARITQRQVCEEFGIAHRFFTQIATEYNIRVYTPADDPAAAITGMSGGSNAGTWLDLDGFAKFRDVMGVREEWTAAPHAGNRTNLPGRDRQPKQ